MATGSRADTPARILPPVDVTEVEVQDDDSGDEGRVTVSTLLPPVYEASTEKSGADKKSDSVRLKPVESKNHRAIFNELRRSGISQGSRKASVAREGVSIATGPVLPSGIRQVGGQDDGAGVISIPSLSIEPPSPTVPNTVASESSPTVSKPVYQVWGQPAGKVNMKRVQKKQRREVRRAQPVRRFGLLEFYDPDLERLDVDDYDRRILLTSGDEPTTVETSEEEIDSGKTTRQLFDRNITAIKPTLNYAWGDRKPSTLPPDFYSKMDNGEYKDRLVPRTVLQWEPTNLWYHPLYFEDPALERYGHTRGPLMQSAASTGRFFGQIALLPYQMALSPPTSREFALGYYQPGEWAPKKKYRLPFNEEATAAEFLWITGLVLLIP